MRCSHSLKRGLARSYGRRGMAVVKSLVGAAVALAAVGFAYREGVKWVVQKALENSKTAMPEFEKSPIEGLTSFNAADLKSVTLTPTFSGR